MPRVLDREQQLLRERLVSGLSDVALVRRRSSGNRLPSKEIKHAGMADENRAFQSWQPVSVLYSKGSRNGAAQKETDAKVRQGLRSASNADAARKPYVASGDRMVGKRATSAPANSRTAHEVLRRPDSGLKISGVNTAHRPVSADANPNPSHPIWRLVSDSSPSAANGNVRAHPSGRRAGDRGGVRSAQPHRHTPAGISRRLTAPSNRQVWTGADMAGQDDAAPGGATDYQVHGSSPSYRVQRSQPSAPQMVAHDAWLEEGGVVRLGTSRSRSVPNMSNTMTGSVPEAHASSTSAPSQPAHHHAKTSGHRSSGSGGSTFSSTRISAAAKSAAQKASIVGHRDAPQQRQQQQHQPQPHAPPAAKVAADMEFVAACGTGARGVAALNRSPRGGFQHTGQPAASSPAAAAADSSNSGFLPLQLRRQRSRPNSADCVTAHPMLSVTTPDNPGSVSPSLSTNPPQPAAKAEAWVEPAQTAAGAKGMEGPDSPPLLGSPPASAPTPNQDIATNNHAARQPRQLAGRRLVAECQGLASDLFGTDLHSTLLGFLAMEDQVQEEMGRRQGSVSP